MNEKLLLTGIGGSIGVHTFAHIMHNTDWDVVGIDSFRHKGWCDRVVVMLKEHPEWEDRLTIFTHDLVAPFSELLKKRIGYVDYIVAMASLSDVEASIKDPVNFIHNNVMLCTNLLEFAREVGPKVFVQFSTDEVYGPTTGKDDGHKEWSPIVPSNPYAASKACQEAIAISYWRTFNVPVVITNTMNNFGEMQQSSKYPVIIQKAVEANKEIEIHGWKNLDGTTGEGSRSYIHSRNCSDALLYILNIPPYLHKPGHVDKPDRYNIVGDKQIGNGELAQLIADLMGKKAQHKLVDFHSTRPGHDRHYGLNGQKLADLGWKSPMSFEDSLSATIKWQQEHGEWIN